MISISVVTPSLNSAGTVGRTLESVRAQAHARIEHFVVDGGSRDGTREVVDRVRGGCLVEPIGGGPYAAMNAGIRLAAGDVVGILNADDWYEPGALAAIVEAFEADPGVDIVHGNIRFVRKDGRREVLRPRRLVPDELVKGMPLFHPAVFVRARVHAHLGLYDEQYRICADYDFILRAIGAGCVFRHLDKVLANMSDGGISAVQRLRSAHESFLCKVRHGLSQRKAAYYAVRKLGSWLASPVR